MSVNEQGNENDINQSDSDGNNGEFIDKDGKIYKTYEEYQKYKKITEGVQRTVDLIDLLMSDEDVPVYEVEQAIRENLKTVSDLMPDSRFSDSEVSAGLAGNVLSVVEFANHMPKSKEEMEKEQAVRIGLLEYVRSANQSLHEIGLTPQGFDPKYDSTINLSERFMKDFSESLGAGVDMTIEGTDIFNKVLATLGAGAPGVEGYNISQVTLDGLLSLSGSADALFGALGIPGFEEKVEGKTASGSTATSIDQSINDGDNGADNIPRPRRRRRARDPLVLDLADDGLEFVDLADSNAYFDMDGDGFAHNTAWLGANDGFLVYDKNNDRRINDVNELFGNPEMTGIEELSGYDSNDDNVIDANDKIYSQLEVWRDLNGDGISQEVELASLSDYRIESISLDRQDEVVEDGDATIIGTSDYIRSDGSLGTVGDVLLANQSLLSQYVGEYQLAEGIDHISNVNGYGRLPDLHIAMSLNQELLDLVKEAVLNENIDSIDGAFENILYEWAGVKNISLTEIDTDPQLNGNDEERTVRFARANVTLTYEQLGVLKEYTGRENLNIGDGQTVDSQTGVTTMTGRFYLNAWNALYTDLFTKFIVGSGLLSNELPDVSYNERIDKLVWLDESVDFAEEQERLVGNLPLNDTDAVGRNLLADLVVRQFDPTLSNSFAGSPSEVMDRLGYSNTEFAKLIATPLFETVASAPVIKAFEGEQGGAGHDYVIGDELNNTLNGNAGNDFLAGYEGDDALTDSGSGNDVLSGGEGDDALKVRYGNNTLSGDEGNDTLTIERYDRSGQRYGTNTLSGGAGDDRLEGYTGADTYQFNRGDGHDVINDYGYSYGMTDKIVFGEGILREHLSATHDGNHIILTIADPAGLADDQITIESGFTHSYYKIERIEFADGDVITASELQSLAEVVHGTEGDDTLTGTSVRDVLHGYGGNDTLTDTSSSSDAFFGGEGNDTLTDSGSGNDVLSGGEGDDALKVRYGNNTLSGDEGNDTLTIERYDRSGQRYGTNTLSGGAGDDRLEGYTGADTYQFNRGDGHDVINDYGYSYGMTDKIVFGEGILREHLSATHDGNHIILTIADPAGLADDQITIESGFTHSYYKIERIEFADGDVITASELQSLAEVVHGTEGDDTLTGTSVRDVLHGYGGNDTLTDTSSSSDAFFGGEGNDTLTDSGSGNDVLSGGEGDDALKVRYGNNTLSGDEGNDTLTIERYDRSGQRYGTNTLSGGAGDDRLEGYTGADTYQFNRGDGHDVINDYGYSYGMTDKIVFGEGILREHLSATHEGNHIILTIADPAGLADDQITIESGFTHSYYKIERIEFADGDVITASELQSLAEVVHGTEGDDTLTGTSVRDVLHGYGGNDTLTDTSSSSDAFFGGEGNDTLTDSGSGNDVLSGGEGDDALKVRYGNNTLSGDEGNDTLTIERYDRSGQRYGTNTLSGGAGDDRLEGYTGADTYQFNRGDGHDVINDYGYSYGMTDKIVFGEGILREHLSATHDGNHIILTIADPAGLADDQITIESGFTHSYYKIERIEFADGDVITASELQSLAEVVHGTEGDDTLTGTSVRDVLHGYGGNDTLTDTSSSSDAFFGGEGNDTLTDSGSGNDVLSGGEGDDALKVRYGNNTLSGDEGNDTLTIERYDRSGQRYGTNTLSGGAGDDRLEGYTGADTYQFNRGDGHDVINDYGYSYGMTDKIVFGEGILREHLSATHDGNHIILTIADPAGLADDQITIESGFTHSYYKIERIEFADGDVITASELQSLAEVVHGTEGDDTLTGTSVRDVLHGYGGNDTLTDTSSSSDAFFGGEGNDTLTDSGSGNDVLSGGEGDDALKVRYGNNTLSGDEGNDTLTIERYDRSGQRYGTNTLSGGAGDDRLEGYTGADTYQFNRGDGHDVINDYGYSYGMTDKIVFGEGILREHLSATHDGNHIILTIADPAGLADDQITIESGFTHSYYKIERIEFADGDVITASELQSLAEVVHGTEGDDTLTGTSVRDVLHGYGGNDTLTDTSSSSDAFFGGEGNDTLTDSGSGNDVLSGGEGDDALKVRYGNNTLSGDEGNDTLTIERYDRSGQRYGTNTLSGGAGDDRLEGYTGADTYQFNRGDGHDVINDYGYSYGMTDKIVFGEGILREHLSATHEGNHIILTIADPAGLADDQITIESGFTHSYYKIERIEFADGEVIGASELQSLAEVVHGTEGDDTLIGTNLRDVLYGYGGNDTLTETDSSNNVLSGGTGDDVLQVRYGNNTLSGDEGNDTLTIERYDRSGQRYGTNTLSGGAGDDRLEGYTGADTYQFNRGDGHDVINDYGYSYGMTDKIVFGEGILREHLSATHDGNHIILTIADPAGLADDQITIESGFTHSYYKIERIEFADGDVITASELQSLAEVVHGTEGDDTLIGTNLRDVLYGYGGNDTLTETDSSNNVLSGGTGDDVLQVRYGNNTLSGDEGNDTLTIERYDRSGQRYGTNTLSGGAGDDRLEGYTGADTYQFNRGDGHDVINDYGYSYGMTDKIVFGEGILREHLSATHDGNHIILTIADPAGLADDQITIESGFTHSYYKIERIEFADGDVITASELQSLAEVVHGTEGDDTLIGTNLRDVLYGYGGNDTLTETDSSNNVLSGGTGDDVLQVRYGNNTLSGDEGNDTLTIERYDRSGQRYGTNTLSGGAGDDRLEGYTGADTYQFNRGDGHDVINDYGYSYGMTDSLQLGEGIESNNLWFSRVGDNLVIDIENATDRVTVENWYSGSYYQIESINTEGNTLDHSRVDALVQAMAAFDAPNGVGEEIPQDVKDQLQPVLASSWQPVS